MPQETRLARLGGEPMRAERVFSIMRCVLLLSLLFSFLTCHGLAPDPKRGVKIDMTVTESIDWTQSAGIFIGIESFIAEAGAPQDVRYAADDATDLAWLFAKELPSLLPPDRTLLLLSGRPHKRGSQEHLLVLQREGPVAERRVRHRLFPAVRSSSSNAWLTPPITQEIIFSESNLPERPNSGWNPSTS